MPVLLHAGWNFWSGAFGQEISMFLLPLFLLTAIVVGIATRGKLGLAAQDSAPTLTEGTNNAIDPDLIPTISD